MSFESDDFCLDSSGSALTGTTEIAKLESPGSNKLVLSLLESERHNCHVWSGFESRSLTQLINTSFGSDSITKMNEVDLRNITNIFKPKPITDGVLSGRSQSSVRRPNPSVGVGQVNEGGNENTWMGLNSYKKQKSIKMYPKDMDKERFFLNEVYRKLLLRKLQLTLSELEDFRRQLGHQHSNPAITMEPSGNRFNEFLHKQPGQKPVNYRQLQFQIPDSWSRPVSAHQLSGKVNAGPQKQGRFKKASSNFDALDIEAKQKQVECQAICSYLAKTENEQTSVRVPHSLAATLYRTMKQSTDKLAPYKNSLTNKQKFSNNVQARAKQKDSILAKRKENTTLNLSTKGSSLNPNRSETTRYPESETIYDLGRNVSRLLTVDNIRSFSSHNENCQLQQREHFLKTAAIMDISELRDFLAFNQMNFE